MPTAIRRFVRDLGLDAYVVGGAVRDELLGIPHSDEDFLVPGVDHAGLRRALEPHGRVKDLEVHGQLVGVRLHPANRTIRALTPSGIEFTPPRAERSTGPGHRDFAIVSDPGIGIEEDMARRDFTVNAMARRLATDELVDPFGGLGDLARRELRMVSAGSFEEDPLRLLRALRFVSQLGFDLEGSTVAQMRVSASGLRHVSGERIGGGLKGDGFGELSKLLLGPRPAKALRLARDTGVLQLLIAEYEAAIGYELRSKRQRGRTLDEHLFEVTQLSADWGAPLAVRLAALVHDLGKPEADRDRVEHAALGASIAARTLALFRYPVQKQHHVERIVRHHAFTLDNAITPAFARRFLATYGDVLAFDLVALKQADLAAKNVPEAERDALEDLRAALEREKDSPHRIHDLAVNGDDLIEMGFRQGPGLGRVLRLLLEEVVEDPSHNNVSWLLARAARERS